MGILNKDPVIDYYCRVFRNYFSSENIAKRKRGRFSMTEHMIECLVEKINNGEDVKLDTA